MEKLIKLDDAIEACSEAQGRSDSKGFLRGVSAVWSKIKKLQTIEHDEIPHWIPASEKPKTSGEYLVLLENGDMFNANFDKDSGDDGEFGIWQNRYDEHTLGFLDSEWQAYEGITHWQPLPQPPKWNG